MTITEKQLRDLIKDPADLEKISTVSSDGRNLLTRIPKQIKEKISLKKGDKLRWVIKKGEIHLEVQDAK